MENLKFSEFPARLKESIADSIHFQQALKRLAEGKPSTPASWVYENYPVKSKVLNLWIKELSKLLEVDNLKLIAEWDLSKVDKFAPQGGSAPFEYRLDTLSEYWKHLSSPDVFSSRQWKRAISLVTRMLGFNQSGKPLSVDAVINRGLGEDKYNSSSGDPLFLKRKNPKAIEQAKNSVLNGTWKDYYPVLGTRASMGKTGTEARWIFMFPMSTNLQEQRYVYALMDYIRNMKPSYARDFFIPWDGYEKVQAFISKHAPLTQVKFGCDYSKMDQHFNEHHGFQVYEVIKHFFNPIYWEELKDIIYNVFHCPVVSPNGLIEGPHAMPSGSGWTNFLETMFNLILVTYLNDTYHLNILHPMGIGDDQLWFFNNVNDTDKLTKFVVSQFNAVGLEANAEKQEVSTTMTSFLQRRSYDFWSPDDIQYAGVYPTIRALTSEIYPEYYHNEKEWDKNMFALRCLMILENTNRHPLFKEFCIFIAKGNENIVEFAKSDDAHILLTRARAKKIANFIPSYNQEKMDVNPTKFESLAIIREYFK